MATGMELVNYGMKIDCEHCLKGKMARIPFPHQAEHKTTQPLELVYTFLCEPMSNMTPGENKYFMVFIDGFSRYLMLYLLKDKAETNQFIKNYVELVENQIERKLPIFSSDRGAEFVNKELEQSLTSRNEVKRLR